MANVNDRYNSIAIVAERKDDKRRHDAACVDAAAAEQSDAAVIDAIAEARSVSLEEAIATFVNP